MKRAATTVVVILGWPLVAFFVALYAAAGVSVGIAKALSQLWFGQPHPLKQPKERWTK